MIPPPVIQTILDIHPTGAAWLAAFPGYLERWQEQWQLRLEAPFENLSYHYVAPGLGLADVPVVLKAGPPSIDFQREITALQAYGGRTAVALLAFDAQQGAMLLEHIRPGLPLIDEEDDAQATAIAARVMQSLWRTPEQVAAALHQSQIDTGPASVPDPIRLFPAVADWGQGFARLRRRYAGGSGPFPARLVDRAEQIFADLTASMATPVLLHGDLHHENILAHRTPDGTIEWRVIDPKGVWGEPAYEPGAWLRNPMSRLQRWQQPRQLLQRRIAQFAEHLELDRARIAGWGFAQAVLSAWWSLEDHPGETAGSGTDEAPQHNPGWQQAMAVAEWLAPLAG